MGSLDVEQYVKMRMEYENSADEFKRKELEEKMFRLWYYYMSPADKKNVTKAMGEQTFDWV